jgi:outer membrane protein OmpU
MRKILLAGVATVAMTGAAAASGLEPTLGSSSAAITGTAAPGKAIVRLDGYLFFAAGVGSNTLDKAPNGAKSDSFGFMNTFRLYPSFDAQTAGGLRYGAFAEIRSNGNSAGSTTLTGATSGVVGGGNQRTTNTLFVNRAWGYVGTDQLGRLQFGQVDGITSIMRTGTFEGQIADGGWNGWAPGMTAGVNPWRFAASGGDLATKVVYSTPVWSGLQLGVSFAPSSANNQAGFGAAVATGGAVRQAASVLASDLQRPRNMVQAAGRYTGTFGGVGVQAMVGYFGSAAIQNANVGGASNRGLSIVSAGATVSYMGFMVGGYMETGTHNGGQTLLARGEKDATTYTIGASYTNGPWVVGAGYVKSSTAGVAGNNAMRTDDGIHAGVTYTYVPGARLFVELVTGTAKERGRNLSNDVLPAGSTKSIKSTAVILGNSFRF